jgi:general secretion pathway protein M
MAKLNKRERIAVSAAVVVVALFLVFQFVVTPYREKQARLARSLQSKTEALREMKALKAQYEALTEQARLSKVRFARRERGFTLFSFLDRLASEAGIKDHITYMKPSRVDDKDTPYRISLVEMKLQDITLKQLTPYLHMVETSENVVYIRRMSITRTGREGAAGLIDAVLQVETYEV